MSIRLKYLNTNLESSNCFSKTLPGLPPFVAAVGLGFIRRAFPILPALMHHAYGLF
ncbi:hypothetical protein Cflav_PD2365 [Pedosphaera parvula Ellin514]|uniref:Uncharacterized protein n=1 Tax=Pedosphaera parvula (strain Ellin514) TaxID=320771 RepID=B9XL27_PEDPL|nr:hypothetical protein Cflav_PD2365 [Pedosphaera parvula Ellin514]